MYTNAVSEFPIITRRKRSISASEVKPAGATVGQKWMKQVIRASHLHGGNSGSQMLRTVFQ